MTNYYGRQILKAQIISMFPPAHLKPKGNKWQGFYLKLWDPELWDMRIWKNCWCKKN